jgi:AcrR family transcriptional regulator
MAIDVKSIVIDALLSLVEDEGVPLERITVKRILECSGVSRQTFYNHFLDKNDLICQTYEKRMVVAFNDAGPAFDYRDELAYALRRYLERGGLRSRREVFVLVDVVDLGVEVAGDGLRTQFSCIRVGF